MIAVVFTVIAIAAVLGGWSSWHWRKKAAELAKLEERARAYARMSSDWYWEQDENLRFTWLSGGIFEKAKMRAESFYGRTRWEMLATCATEETAALFADHRKTLEARQPFHDFEYPIMAESGDVHYVSVNGEPILDSDGRFKGYRGTGKDITERKRVEDLVRHMAQYDALTGLPNRALFFDRLGKALDLSQRNKNVLGVLYFDLDRFKPVNDKWGHRAGDMLLTAVAARALGCVRKSDTLARLGGDEFAVLLQDVKSRENAQMVAGKIDKSLSQPFSLAGIPEPVNIGASIGIVMFPGDAGDAEELVRLADAAMYVEKKRKCR